MLDQVKAEQSLEEFVVQGWSILEPGTTLKRGWTLGAVCEHLEAVTAGQIDRLLMNVPPGFMKSMLTNVFWPMWEWGPKNLAHLRYVCFSYSSSLTERDNDRCRNLLRSDWYRDAWGDRVQLSKDNTIRFENERRGWKLATSVGGVGTGERGNRAICFPGDTKVVTRDGAVDIGVFVAQRSNEEVATRDVRTGEFKWGRATGWHRNPASELVRVVLSDGSSVRCTPGHKFWVHGEGWVAARALSAGAAVDALPDTVSFGDFAHGSPSLDGVHYVDRNTKPGSEGRGSVCAACDSDSIFPACPRAALEFRQELFVSLSVSDVLAAGSVSDVPGAVIPGVIVEVPDVSGLGVTRPDEELCYENMDLFVDSHSTCPQTGPRVGAPVGIEDLSWDRETVPSAHDCAGQTAHAAVAADFVAGRPGDRAPLLRVTRVEEAGVVPETFCISVHGTGSFYVLPERCSTSSGPSQLHPILSKNCDDLHNVKEGESVAIRTNTTNWFREVLPSRLNDAEKDVIMVIMQRVNAVDVSGIILAQDHGYTHLNIPMEFEPERRCYGPIRTAAVPDAPAETMRYVGARQRWYRDTARPFDKDLDEGKPPSPDVIDTRDVDAFEEAQPRVVYNQDPRTHEGELAWPERFPPKVIERDKKMLGPFAWAGQYQQRPEPREGAMFKRIWFNVINSIPQHARVCAGWDFAGTGEQEGGQPAYTARALVARWEENGYPRFAVAKVMRLRGTSAEVEKALENTSSQDRAQYPGVLISIPQDPGQAGKGQARNLCAKLAGYTVRATIESGDKVTRAEAAAAQSEIGNVALLQGDWHEEFLDELTAFPFGQFKDQVDAFARAFNELNAAPEPPRVRRL